VIDGPAAAKVTRKQYELLYFERPAREQRVMRQELHDFFAWRCFQSRQCHVRREFALLGRQSKPLNRGFDLLL